jgi:predicted RNA-binding protein with PIN domain
LAVLIGGNNLLFAAREVDDPDRPPGRSLLCQVLALWAARTRQRVRIVFDGPRPAEGFAAQIAASDVDVLYSGSSSADEVLIELLENDSAAHHLTVVSSDRAIQRAARRRRAKPVASIDFWRDVRRKLRQSPAPPAEPPEKRGGLSADQVAD